MKTLIQILNEQISKTFLLTKAVNPRVTIKVFVNNDSIITKIENPFKAPFVFHKGDRTNLFQIQNFADLNGYKFEEK